MHVYSQYAGEFVMGNNTVAPFHLISFLSESETFPCFQRQFRN